MGNPDRCCKPETARVVKRLEVLAALAFDIYKSPSSLYRRSLNRNVCILKLFFTRTATYPPKEVTSGSSRHASSLRTGSRWARPDRFALRILLFRARRNFLPSLPGACSQANIPRSTAFFVFCHFSQDVVLAVAVINSVVQCIIDELLWSKTGCNQLGFFSTKFL